MVFLKNYCFADGVISFMWILIAYCDQLNGKKICKSKFDIKIYVHGD